MIQAKSVHAGERPSSSALSWIIASGRTGERLRAVRDGTDMSVVERIEYALDLMTPEDQAAVGRSKKQMGRYLKGADVPLSVLTELSVRSGLPIDWIVSGRASTEREVLARLTGAGDPVGSIAGLAEAEAAPYGFGGQGVEDFAFIPRLEVEASAGSGALASQEGTDDMLAFRREWLRRVGVNPAAARVLRARGDSMEPTIRDGDILLVDTSIDRVADEGIYIVIVAGLVLVKRLEIRRNGMIILKSDNAARYGEERIPSAEAPDLSVAGRVMWFGRSI